MALCNFRTLGNPASCPAAGGGPHGFCSVHERIYDAMNAFGFEKQTKGRDTAIKWAKEHRYEARQLEQLGETFDPNCIRKAG